MDERIGGGLQIVDVQSMDLSGIIREMNAISDSVIVVVIFRGMGLT
jgi:hypothetical protein